MSAEEPLESPPGDRLDSWKEIAAFLHRDVRTVQRWEKHAGLPIHRHGEARLRTAYAYRSELDAWWRSHQVTAESGAATPLPVAWPGLRRSVMAAGLLGTAVLVSGLLANGIFQARQPRPDPPTDMASVSVLLTRFEDETGDAKLALLLEERVTRQLDGHSGIETVRPDRIARTLELMRRLPDSSLTEALAHEVAIRDGRIHLVITGRIHSVDSEYFLDLSALDPSDSRVRLSLEWHGRSRQDLVSRVTAALSRIGDRIFQAAAEAAPVEPLEEVTTSSLAALRLYTAAVHAGGRREWGASELLARRAIAADEEFASAHAWAAWTMRQQGRPRSDCLPLLQRAIALSTGTTDRESYFISGVLHSLTGDLSAAIAALEAVLRLEPAHAQTLDLLIDAYWRAGRVRKAADLSVVRAEHQPDDFYANVRAAHALVLTRPGRSRAAGFVRRAHDLASPQAVAERPSWAAWLTLFPAFEQWLGGDRRGALETIVPLEQSLASRVGRERDAYATAVGFAYLAFGRALEADRAFRHAATPVRQLNLAMLAITLDDEASARRSLLQIREHSAARPALFASVGLHREAEDGLDRSLPSEHAEGRAAVTRGLIAARNRDMPAAFHSLRQGAELLRFTGEPEYFLAVEALARMAVASGEIARAIGLLSDAVAQRACTYGAAWTGAHWVSLTEELAAIYRRQGRSQEADGVTAPLGDLLDGAEFRKAALRP